MSECDWSDDTEMPDAYVHVERKAAKPHRCCECHGVIPKGELYHVHSGIWNGTPMRYKRCADCEAFCCDLGCVPFLQLNEEVLNREGPENGLLAKWKAIKSLRRPNEIPTAVRS